MDAENPSAKDVSGNGPFAERSVDPQSRQLDVVEHWFQAVVTHPAGVRGGIESEDAQRLIPLGADELERVIRRSKNLTAAERLSVYANAYYARLLDCLGESFPVLKRTVGEEAFGDLAFAYLQDYPSRSYTLALLADAFPRYLEETRPDRDNVQDTGEVDWPDLLVDLAKLECAIGKVFDGPGVENSALLAEAELRSVSAERWPEARLVPVVCLKLLRFRYPINAYYTAVRRAEEDVDVPLPEAGEQFVALTRKQFIVRRYELSQPQFTLLGALQGGATIGESIERVAKVTDMGTQSLAESLRNWFRGWTAAGFFETIAG
jgi:hypothetical protein